MLIFAYLWDVGRDGVDHFLKLIQGALFREFLYQIIPKTINDQLHKMRLDIIKDLGDKLRISFINLGL